MLYKETMNDLFQICNFTIGNHETSHCYGECNANMMHCMLCEVYCFWFEMDLRSQTSLLIKITLPRESTYLVHLLTQISVMLAN